MHPFPQLCLLYTSYIMDHTHIDRDILYIDGTKYEAYANKMTDVYKRQMQNSRLSIPATQP